MYPHNICTVLLLSVILSNAIHSPLFFSDAFISYVHDQTGDRHNIYFEHIIGEEKNRSELLRARVFHGVDSYNDVWLCTSSPSLNSSSLLFQHWGINATEDVPCHYYESTLSANENSSCLEAFLDRYRRRKKNREKKKHFRWEKVVDHHKSQYSFMALRSS